MRKANDEATERSARTARGGNDDKVQIPRKDVPLDAEDLAGLLDPDACVVRDPGFYDADDRDGKIVYLRTTPRVRTWIRYYAVDHIHRFAGRNALMREDVQSICFACQLYLACVEGDVGCSEK